MGCSLKVRETAMQPTSEVDGTKKWMTPIDTTVAAQILILEKALCRGEITEEEYDTELDVLIKDQNDRTDKRNAP